MGDPAKVQITDELIEAGRSDHGGWSKEQFAVLGLSWPPTKGWKGVVIGKEISRVEAERFVELKNRHIE